MVVYPVPAVASTLWAAVRRFLSKSTAAKVTLLAGSDRAGSPAPEALRRWVSYDELRCDVQASHAGLATRADE